MKKYDCHKTIDYFHELMRLCDSYDDYGCHWCPLYDKNEHCCGNAEIKGESAIEILQKWSDNNLE